MFKARKGDFVLIVETRRIIYSDYRQSEPRLWFSLHIVTNTTRDGKVVRTTSSALAGAKGSPIARNVTTHIIKRESVIDPVALLALNWESHVWDSIADAKTAILPHIKSVDNTQTP